MTKWQYIYRILFNKGYSIENLKEKAYIFNKNRIANWNKSFTNEEVIRLQKFVKKTIDENSDFVFIYEWLGRFLDHGIKEAAEQKINFIYKHKKEISLLSESQFIIWNDYLAVLETDFSFTINQTVRTHVEKILLEVKENQEEEILLEFLKDYPFDDDGMLN